MIYLDNAATSFPKPPVVSRAMVRYVEQVGATINRSVYGPAQEAGLVTLQLRERLCRLLGFGGAASHAVLTGGCSMALNQILLGYLQPGDHVLVTALEHNAVMRPLHTLGVTFDRLPCDRQGLIDPEEIRRLRTPRTRLVIAAHASNVCGAVQDAEAMGRICADLEIPFVLDAAQSAGHIAVDFDRFRCSALAVPGHKGLLGPSGIGAMLLRPDFAKTLRPVFTGGTGSASHTEVQPPFLPDKFESGTPNLPGIYGWEAALAFLEDRTVEAVRQHDLPLMAQFLEGVSGLAGVRVLGPRDLQRRVGVFSLDFPGRDNALLGDRLEREFGILTRCGLHCAPAAHRALGTYPQGTIRFSLGWANTARDVQQALEAIRILAQGKKTP